MATVLEISLVRLNIADTDATDYDFTNDQIEYYIDEEDNINYASCELLNLLIAKLRKEIIKKDVTGEESTEFVALKEQLAILNDLYAKYAAKYKSDMGTNTGQYIASEKPEIAGGDT